MKEGIAYWAMLGMEFEARRKSRWRDGTTGSAVVYGPNGAWVEVRYYPRSNRYNYFTKDGVSNKGAALEVLGREMERYGG